ncbi:MAG: hypothetical protein KBC34_12960 [Phenylobacterium sp.]|nr:hypothetical protein [Phenylobacterium sp.]
MKQDHRQNYSPTTLYVAGLRMTNDYTVDGAVEDYMAMHPDADEAAVRAEIEAIAAPD